MSEHAPDAKTRFAGEATVNSFADSIGLSLSALSQHLAKMRDEGLVTYRCESASDAASAMST